MTTPDQKLAEPTVANSEAIGETEIAIAPGLGRRVTMARQSIGVSREVLEARVAAQEKAGEPDILAWPVMWAALAAQAAQYALLRGAPISDPELLPETEEVFRAVARLAASLKAVDPYPYGDACQAEVDAEHLCYHARWAHFDGVCLVCTWAHVFEPDYGVSLLPHGLVEFTHDFTKEIPEVPA